MGMKELREYRRQIGLCIYCGGERDDGFLNCSSCRLKINARHSRTRNKEKDLARGRERYKENREKKLAKMKEWREQNPGYFSAYHHRNKDRRSRLNRKWRQEHLKTLREKNRQWAASNPDRVAAKGLRRRARMIKNGGHVTANELKEIRRAYSGLCPYCREEIQIGHFDHIIPLSAGGRNSAENIIYCCQTCNLNKGNFSLVEFLHRRVSTKAPLRRRNQVASKWA